MRQTAATAPATLRSNLLRAMVPFPPHSDTPIAPDFRRDYFYSAPDLPGGGVGRWLCTGTRALLGLRSCRGIHLSQRFDRRRRCRRRIAGRVEQGVEEAFLKSGLHWGA